MCFDDDPGGLMHEMRCSQAEAVASILDVSAAEVELRSVAVLLAMGAGAWASMSAGRLAAEPTICRSLSDWRCDL